MAGASCMHASEGHASDLDLLLPIHCPLLSAPFSRGENALYRSPGHKEPKDDWTNTQQSVTARVRLPYHRPTSPHWWSE